MSEEEAYKEVESRAALVLKAQEKYMKWYKKS